MIKLPAFKRIFPINRTRVYPSWGNSYVGNWIRFETFIGGVDVGVMCIGTPNHNNRIYTHLALLFNTARHNNICIGSFPHLGMT